MRDFVISMMCAGVASGVIGMFFDGDTMGKHIKTVLSICIVSMLLVCGTRFFGKVKLSVPDFYKAENVDLTVKSYEDFVIENTRAEMCATLKRMIFEKSGITPDGVDIQFSINSNDTKTIVDVATVTIYSQKLCGNSEILEYVYGLTGKKPLICDKKE